MARPKQLSGVRRYLELVAWPNYLEARRVLLNNGIKRNFSSLYLNESRR